LTAHIAEVLHKSGLKRMSIAAVNLSRRHKSVAGIGPGADTACDQAVMYLPKLRTPGRSFVELPGFFLRLGVATVA
jgi:hypothetical protein